MKANETKNDIMMHCNFKKKLLVIFVIINSVLIQVLPVNGLGRISYDYWLHYASPVCLITCILFHLSIFHFILYLFFPHSLGRPLPLLSCTSNSEVFTIAFSSSFVKASSYHRCHISCLGFLISHCSSIAVEIGEPQFFEMCSMIYLVQIYHDMLQFSGLSMPDHLFPAWKMQFQILKRKRVN